MRTAEDVLAKHGSAVLPAALELARRFQDDDTRLAAAAAWCDHVSSVDSASWEDSGHSYRDKEWEAAHELCAAAMGGHPVLGEWVQRAVRHIYMHGLMRREVRYSQPLIAALLTVWPDRATPLRFPELLEAWARRADQYERGDVAAALYDFPDVAFRILGPLHGGDEEPACFGCDKHERRFGSRWCSHLDVVRLRRLHALPRDEREAAVLSAIPSSAYLDNTLLVLAARRWLRCGLNPPPTLAYAVEHARDLEPASEPWGAAVALLCSHRDWHEEGVRRLSEAVRASNSPKGILPSVAVTDVPRFGHEGLFVGRGWGKKERRKKLLPLVRAMLDRGCWSKGAWQASLAIADEEAFDAGKAVPDEPEAVLKRQQELLAEGLLDVALDGGCVAPRRRRALDALEVLAPGGDGSWVRALSKIESPPDLCRHANDVQRRLSQRRGAYTDPEFAIDDALDIMFAASEER